MNKDRTIQRIFRIKKQLFKIMETKNENTTLTKKEPLAFTCIGCKHELPVEFQIRTAGYCYLCDPNVTVSELLSDESINN